MEIKKRTARGLARSTVVLLVILLVMFPVMLLAMLLAMLPAMSVATSLVKPAALALALGKILISGVGFLMWPRSYLDRFFGL